MNSHAVVIRPMRQADIAAVLVIQAVCYTEIVPESRASLLAKLTASPSTCFVAGRGDETLGYLIAMPWLLASPPRLNAEACCLPSVPDCLYLHDLAVATVGRGNGAGHMLVQAFLDQLSILRLERACLVAIQNSGTYWARYGFRAVRPSAQLQAQLASYGDSVCYMELSRRSGSQPTAAS